MMGFSGGMMGLEGNMGMMGLGGGMMGPDGNMMGLDGGEGGLGFPGFPGMAGGLGGGQDGDMSGIPGLGGVRWPYDQTTQQQLAGMSPDFTGNIITVINHYIYCQIERTSVAFYISVHQILSFLKLLVAGFVNRKLEIVITMS